jgi:predicted DNA-binding transcriptional regulator YafY
VAQHFGLDPAGAHRALADSLRVKDIWLHLGGHVQSRETLVSYRMFGPADSIPPPDGWERLPSAVASGLTVRIGYDGGSRGLALRSIIPRRFEQRDGLTYLIAFCQLDSFEKSFRVDRIRVLEFLPEDGSAPVHVDRPVAGG